jgi:ribonuclease Z
MQAENILLTHFSARYPKMPQSEAAQDSLDSRNYPTPPFGIAFDHSKIRIREMPKLHAYLPAIGRYFDETAEEQEKDDDEISAAAMEP